MKIFLKLLSFALFYVCGKNDTSNRKKGGWANPLISDWFADYARVAFTLFGDRVKTWITINEPLVVCELGYNGKMFPPLVPDPEFGNFLCNKHILIAHAKAYRLYDEDFRFKYEGEVGITNQLIWIEAETGENEELAELGRELCVGMYSHAIYSEQGGWPPSIEKFLAEKSKKKGMPNILPAFTKEEIDLVRGSSDFYGFNHYTSRAIRKAVEGEPIVSWPLGDAPLLDAKLVPRAEWLPGGSFWFFIHPEGIRKQLAWLKARYGDIKILITENGYADKANRGTLEDLERVNYYKDYLEQVLLSIKEDGVNVVGYTAWSLMDNFEWTDGYSVTFGLYEVDFEDPKRPRRARASARYYASIIKTNTLDLPNEYIKNEL